MGLFDKVREFFGGQSKRDTAYTGRRPSAIKDLPSYQSASELLRSIGTPESYAGVYEREAYEPYRQSAIYNLENVTKPGVEADLQRSGLDPNSTFYQDILSRPSRDLPYNLATTRADLRTQGLNRGFEQQGQKLTGLQNLLGREQTQDAAGVAFDLGDYNSQMNIANARREANRQAYQNMINTAGSIATGGLLGGATGGLGTLLGRLNYANQFRRNLETPVASLIR